MATPLIFSACLPATRRANPGIVIGENAPLAFDRGTASFYADSFEGKSTANGEIFRQDQMTAAHRTYPFGTILRIINTSNNREAIVRVNDRGPAKDSRLIDVSRRAAEDLRMVRDGTAPVRVEVLQWGK
jgi:rare lipoprotein A